MPIKVARIFNTYGPRMQLNDGRVVSNFIVQALQGAPLTIYGEGAQTRAFCYVDDLVEGLVRLMATPSEVTGPINLGNAREVTVVELAEMVIRLTRSSSRIVRLARPEDDPAQRCPDLAQARAALHWEARIPLEDGLARTVEDFRQRLPRGARAAQAGSAVR
jgi:UDP-glucuronate decarboxylase